MMMDDMMMNDILSDDISSIEICTAESRTAVAIDWNLCCICQNDGTARTNDTLFCPSAHTQSTHYGRGYITLAANLKALAELDELPEWVKIQQLDEGDGIEATLRSNDAKYHKKCTDQFNSLRIFFLMKKKLFLPVVRKKKEKKDKFAYLVKDAPNQDPPAQKKSSENLSDEVEMRFLHPYGPAKFYQYPAHSDVLEMSSRDVLTLVNPSTATGRSYTLSLDEAADATHSKESMTIESKAAVVAICNNLALVVSECETNQFIVHFKVLRLLLLYWTKGCNVVLQPESGLEQEYCHWYDDIVIKQQMDILPDYSNSNPAADDALFSDSNALSPVTTKDKEITDREPSVVEKAVLSVIDHRLPDKVDTAVLSVIDHRLPDKVDTDENYVTDKTCQSERISNSGILEDSSPVKTKRKRTSQDAVAAVVTVLQDENPLHDFRARRAALPDKSKSKKTSFIETATKSVLSVPVLRLRRVDETICQGDVTDICEYKSNDKEVIEGHSQVTAVTDKNVLPNLRVRKKAVFAVKSEPTSLTRKAKKSASSDAVQQLPDKVDADEDNGGEAIEVVEHKINISNALEDHKYSKDYEESLTIKLQRIRKLARFHKQQGRMRVVLDPASKAKKRRLSQNDNDEYNGDDNNDDECNDDDASDEDYRPDSSDDAERDDDHIIPGDRWASRSTPRVRNHYSYESYARAGRSGVEQSTVPAAEIDKSEKSDDIKDAPSAANNVILSDTDQIDAIVANKPPKPFATYEREGKSFEVRLLKGGSCPLCDKKITKNGLYRHLRNVHNRTVPCTMCDMTFTSMHSLRQHMIVHDNKYKCSFCEQVFIGYERLYRHVIRHTKKYACSICNKSFVSPVDLSRHNMYVHQDNPPPYPHNCLHCGKGFLERRNFEVHTNVHLKPFSCTTCSEKFSNETKLQFHVSKIHGVVRVVLQKELNYHCPLCTKAFSTSQLLNKHIKIHDNLCSICGQTFYDRSKLVAHLRKHEDMLLQSFVCDECNESFSTVAQLKTHRRLHIKPRVCDICNEGFATKEELAAHTDHHGIKQHLKCPSCDEIYTSWTELKAHRNWHRRSAKCELCTICGKLIAKAGISKHLQVHLGLRPFKCSVCDKSFGQESYLRLHELMHTGEKPHVCTTCGRGFRAEHVLRYHQYIHTGERPFSCKVCGKAFHHPTTRSIHMRKHKSKNMFLSDVTQFLYDKD